MEVCIGIPAYNEEQNIAKIIAKLQKVSNKIIVCNDGSSDLTGVIAEKMGAIVVNHPRNLGYGAAIRSIFFKAKEIEADILVTFDADGQHRIEDVNQVIKPIIEDDVDIVIGSRFLDDESKKAVPTYRKIGIKAITSLSNASTDLKLTDSQSGFRAYNKKSLELINPSEYGMGISTEILIKANKNNLQIKEVPITILYRGKTSTHNPISHGLSVIMSTMKFVSIEHPLKFYGLPGIAFLVLGIFFTIWVVNEYLITSNFPIHVGLIGIAVIIVGTMLTMAAILLYSLVNVVREK